MGIATRAPCFARAGVYLAGYYFKVRREAVQSKTQGRRRGPAAGLLKVHTQRELCGAGGRRRRQCISTKGAAGPRRTGISLRL